MPGFTHLYNGSIHAALSHGGEKDWVGALCPLSREEGDASTFPEEVG